jgi:small subunit ribosomal protein S17
MAHDEKDERRCGDIVRIEECRPLSKRKHFTVVELIKPVETFTDPVTGKIWTKYMTKPPK